MTSPHATPTPELLDLAGNDPQEAAQLQAAAAALAPCPVSLPLQFNDALRERLLHRPPAAPRPALRFPHPLAAALFLVGLVLGALLFSGRQGLNPLAPSVAWADVVTAVNRTPSFHISAYIDRPRNATSPGLFRLDLFYQHPGLWRAHGRDHVQFTSQNLTRVYSVKDRAWVDAKNDSRVIPPGFIANLPNHTLLDAILLTLFDGKLPAPEPVQNDDLATAGIVVFDFAQDPASLWARIWVVKDTRLPIRMKIVEPDRDATSLIEFDYTDPQPAAFFDQAAFERDVTSLRDASPARVYAVGTRPLTGNKPREASQIDAVQPGFRAPTVISASRADSGDIVLVTNSPRNVDSRGTRHNFALFALADSWGNTYLPVTWTQATYRGDDTPTTWFLTPLPPFKPGAGDLTLTGTFTLDATTASDTGPLSVIVPPGPLPASAAESLTPAAKRSALRRHLADAPLRDQLAAIDRWLAEDPAALEPRLWKINLLFRHGRAPAGWELFEREAKEPLLAQLPDHATADLLAKYIIHLYVTGRYDEARLIITRLTALRDAARASRNPTVARAAETLFTADHSLLAKACHLPNRLKWAAANPRPALVRTTASHDGMVILELEFPPIPEWTKSDLYSSDPKLLELWGPTPLDSQGGNWALRGRALNEKTNRLFLAYEGRSTALTLHGQVTIIRDNVDPAVAGEITYPWSLPISLPAATVDLAHPWWNANVDAPTKHWFPVLPAEAFFVSPFQQLVDSAETDLRNGRNAAAAREFQSLLDLPSEQWPDHFHGAQNSHHFAATKAGFLTNQIIALARDGQLDHAARLFEAAYFGTPDAPSPFLTRPFDLRNLHVVQQAMRLRGAGLEIARAHAAASRLQHASDLLDRLERDRPVLAGTPETLVETRTGGSVTRGWLKWQNRDAWVPLDTLRWHLLDLSPTPP